MLREEVKQLRIEASAFLDTIQTLPGFSERLANLDLPAVAANWSWAGIRRVLTVPEATWEGLSPGVLRRDEHGFAYEPRPDNDALELIETYAKHVERFAKDLLANVSWGPRATHDAARTGASIKLPRARPEPLIRIGNERTGGAATFSELEAIVKSNRPLRRLRGDRAATWEGATNAVRARLEQRPVSIVNRRHLTNARRYLEASVNRELPSIGQPVEPVEPTDHPLWEAHVSQRLREREEP